MPSATDNAVNSSFLIPFSLLNAPKGPRAQIKALIFAAKLIIAGNY
jgi:hypothetical protein